MSGTIVERARASPMPPDYVRLFECSPALLLVFDANFRIVAASDRYLEATITERETIIGREMFEVFSDNPGEHNDWVSALRVSFERVRDELTIDEMALQRYDIRRRTGEFEVHYWRAQNSPVLNAHGRLTHIVHRVEDVTEYVRARASASLPNAQPHAEWERAGAEVRAAREAIEVQRAVLNMLEDLSEERERMHDGQRAVLNILEDAEEEKRWLESSRDAIGNILEDTQQERARMQETQQAVLNILEDADEERTRIQETQQAVLNILEDAEAERTRIEDTQHAVLNILDDLDSEREQIRRLNAELEDRVRSRTEDLERSNRNLASFAYSVAHDLRQPLRTATSFTDVLLAEYGQRLDERGRSYAERVRRASARMAQLIDDLLALARISRAEVCREPVDLSALAEQIGEDLRLQASGRKVTLVVQRGIFAPVDRELFRTVLENLLSNAWKFTRSRADARVEMRVVESGVGKVAFCVSDNGIGFDPQYSEKLFLPFERLHSAEEYPGTGVGLASVLQIVERHGGSIRATGAVGEGASFQVTVPRERG